MNGDRLAFPQVARMVYFSLWLLCLKYSLKLVVVLLALGRQCFLPDGVSRTHKEHTEELCRAGPSRQAEWPAVQMVVGCAKWRL